jgi:general stress protein 26
MESAGWKQGKQHSRTMNMRLGTWNITQLTRKERKKVGDIKKYEIVILGISETKMKGTGEITLDEN